MAKAYRLMKNFIQYHYLPYLIGGVLFLLLLPIGVGLENLDVFQSAKVLEYWYSLIGLLLLFPLYLPDNDTAALSIIRSKRTSYRLIICVRLIVEIVASGILLVALLIWMTRSNSSFPMGYFILRGIGGALFLGGLSAFTFALFRHPVPCLMVPFLYYLLNMMSKKEYFGPFDLFSVAQGNYQTALLLVLCGGLLLLISLLVAERAKI